MSQWLSLPSQVSMSRPEGQSALGDALTLDLAPPFGSVRIDPINGAHELWLAGRRRNDLPAAALETLVLNAGMVQGGGDPAQWLIGDRNRAIVAVQCAGYGAPDALWVRCPECDEMHEVPFDPSWILDQVPQGPAATGFAVETDAGTIKLRLPVGADLIELGEASQAADVLLTRCAPTAGPQMGPLLEAEIMMRDPCAELRFGLTCLGCGSAFSGNLDPLALLLTEIDRHGGVLSEIDQLARAYHWTETDLLELPAWRRRLYLNQMAERDTRETQQALS